MPRSSAGSPCLSGVRQRDYETLAHGLGVAHEGLHGWVSALPCFELRERRAILYDPYGVVTYLNADWSSKVRDRAQTGSFNWEYLFQGGRINLGDQLYLKGARVYDPFLGRWLQQDPSGQLAGMNLSEYTGSKLH